MVHKIHVFVLLQWGDRYIYSEQTKHNTHLKPITRFVDLFIFSCAKLYLIPINQKSPHSPLRENSPTSSPISIIIIINWRHFVVYEILAVEPQYKIIFFIPFSFRLMFPRTRSPSFSKISIKHRVWSHNIIRSGILYKIKNDMMLYTNCICVWNKCVDFSEHESISSVVVVELYIMTVLSNKNKILLR